MDGSSDSLNSDRTTFQAQFTMRECEEQITTLKKENFNLKLRIYFMEESQGLLHSPKEQAELYKVNIDLKVKSEELKKVPVCLNVFLDSDLCQTHTLGRFFSIPLLIPIFLGFRGAKWSAE